MDEDMETELAEAKKRRDEELAYVMGHALGRRFIWRLLHQVCAIDASNFSSDAMMLSYAQGRRDIGLDIQSALLDFDKQVFLTMEDENR
ncbi:hypothetical protein NB636_01195 [Oxalobacter aliiformigenes]|uniref:Bbp19 family protein n=1 Tax=Oxalobacter aliiformigenes TaxID=2946593 RepID=UPI0022AFA410|nr:hypothetical protein [Oxalobacter aliiformigenes]MCZ4064131.1 hypothetical protein [Oxalobacter aliiformigenes]WAV99507.1 hypothetical protein NB636_01195 [Oxalobacter aliiformigenes]